YSYYRETEIAHALVEARATALITGGDFDGKVDAAAVLRTLLPELTTGPAGEFAAAPDLQVVVSMGQLEALAGAVPVDVLLADVATDAEALHQIRGRSRATDVMNVMYT